MPKSEMLVLQRKLDTSIASISHEIPRLSEEMLRCRTSMKRFLSERDQIEVEDFSKLCNELDQSHCKVMNLCRGIASQFSVAKSSLEQMIRGRSDVKCDRELEASFQIECAKTIGALTQVYSALLQSQSQFAEGLETIFDAVSVIEPRAEIVELAARTIQDIKRLG